MPELIAAFASKNDLSKSMAIDMMVNKFFADMPEDVKRILKAEAKIRAAEA
jgi:hypothetical protein